LPQPAAHAIGMDSSAQGLRANIVLVDDPISVLTVANEPQRQASLEKYLMLKNVRERDGLAFLVGTPYHPQDLFKTIIDLNEKDSDGSFRYRIDPAFTVKPHAKTWPLQGLGPEDVDLLFEEQLPFNELKRSLKSNQRFFESQQLCRFVEIEETVKLNFDRAMLTKCIIPNASVPLEGTVYIFGDTAVSTSARADNSALAVCKLGLNPEGEKTIYVLDMVVGRFRGSELALQLVELTKKWSPHSVTLEKPLTWDLLAGEVSRLGQKYQVHVPIFWSPVSNVKNAKLMRLKGLEITMNAGFFKFVSGLYLEILFNELERLSGDHTSSYRSTTKRDDQADALSIAQKFLLPASASNSEQAKENEELRELQRKQALMHLSYQHYFGSPPQQLPEPSAPVEQDPGHPFDRAGFSKFGFTRAA